MNEEEVREQRRTDPPDPAGRRRAWRLALAAALAAALLVAVLGAVLWQQYREALERPLAVPAGGLIYRVAPGSTIGQVAAELRARGVLAESWPLILAARLADQAARIKAGEYRLEPGISARGLLAVLVRGRVVQHALTLPEGWTFAQLMEIVNRDPNLVHTLEGLSDEEIMERIGRPGVHPEGRFLAETYHFPAGTRDVEFLRRAYAAMERELARQWASRDPDLPLESPEEALVLASIIEKETARADERARIAGVFIRRLRRGMRLETDPTVIYGLGKRFAGNLTRADLRRDTPYNTYTRKGLPPTPIAMPGRAALYAALHPEPGDALYFVATGDGGHYFSATYEEHLKAVRRYQRRRHRRAG